MADLTAPYEVDAAAIADFVQRARDVERELRKVIVGQQDAVRQVLPKGVGAMDLNWTYIGFADDTAEMRQRRLRQANLVGPAGYVSMEDGCVGGFVQRGAAAASDEVSVVNMGGEGTDSMDTRATEASVRGFWKAYRRYMGC